MKKESIKIDIDKLKAKDMSDNLDKLSLVLMFHLIDYIKLDAQIIKCQNQLRVSSIHMKHKTEETLNTLKASKESLRHNLETFVVDISFQTFMKIFKDDEKLSIALLEQDPKSVSDILYTKSIVFLKEILEDIKVTEINSEEEVVTNE